MRAELVSQTIKDLFAIKRPLSIVGPPGGGKTTIVRDVAKGMKIGYIEKHMPTMLVEDFGVPDVLGTDKSFGYKLPTWYPSASRIDLPEEGILCFDDRNQASSDLQKVLANIQQARTLHGVPLKAGWMVVSTGNRKEDRAGANRILSHLANRETVVELETHREDSVRWMLDNGVRPEVIAFVQFRPGLLHKFDPDQDQNPTPRSWVEGVSNILGKVSPEAEYECFAGAVGEGAAGEFVGFIKLYRDLPDIDEVIRNPESAHIPEDPGTLYAFTGAVSDRTSVANIANVFALTKRLPAEYSVRLISAACRRDKNISATKQVTDWSIENHKYMY